MNRRQFLQSIGAASIGLAVKPLSVLSQKYAVIDDGVHGGTTSVYASQDFAVWNTVLSSDDIYALYSGVMPFAVKRDNLLYYIPLYSGEVR